MTRGVYFVYPFALQRMRTRPHKTDIAIHTTLERLEQRRLMAAAGVVDATYGASLGFSGQVTGSMAVPDAATVVRPAVRHAQLATGGKLVVAGSWVYASQNVTGGFIARFNSNGSRDNTFGAGGLLAIPLGLGSASRPTDFAAVVDSAGGVYIADTSSDSVRVRRVRPSGTPDTGFGNNGTLNISTGGQPVAKSMVIAPDGGILVGIDVRGVSPSQKIVVAKFNSAGSMFPSFANNGMASVDPTSRDDGVVKLSVDSSGRPVGVGFATATNNRANSLVFRLTSTGSLDRTFNKTGIATVAVSSNNDRATDVRLGSRGSVLLLARNDTATATLNSGGANAVLVQLSSRGVPESTFGVRGILNTNASVTWTNLRHEPVFKIGPSRTSSGVTEERLLVGDRVYGVSPSGTATLRIDTKPRLDPGTGFTDLPTIVTRGGGLIVVGGQSNGTSATPAERAGELGGQVRSYAYTSTLGRDSSFNSSGVNNNVLMFGAANTTVEVGGTLLLSGVTGDSRITRRYRPNGALDSSLDTDGELITNAVYSPQLTRIGTLARDDGRFVLWSNASRISSGNTGGGLLVQQFDSNGSNLTSLYSGNTRGTANQLPGGDVLARYADQTSVIRFASVLVGTQRFEAIPVGEPILGDSVLAAHVPGAGGDLFVQGQAEAPGDPGTRTTAIYAINGTGDLRTNFGDNGVLSDFARPILFAQADGKLVHRYDLSGISRLNADGSPDAGFGQNGLAAAGFKDFQVDRQGRIIAYRVASNGQVTLLRLDPDGRPDPTFDSDGTATFNIPQNLATSRTRYQALIESDSDIVFSALLDESATARTVRWSSTRIGGGTALQVVNGTTLHISGTAGNDTINAVLDAGQIAVTINGETHHVAVGSINRVIANTFGGNDTATIDLGSSINIRLDGGGGNDSLSVGGGQDTLIGGSGVDTLNAGGGTDLILARDGEVDSIQGGGGTDTAEVDRDDEGNVLDQTSSIDVLR